ncbi:MAG: PAS domain-containing sensor histidine kinase [Pseudomonadota bacterium]
MNHSAPLKSMRPKGNFWQGFVDAILGPKSRISGMRRKFMSRTWQTKLSWFLIIAAIASGFATYAALTETPPFGDDPQMVIWLLNLDLILLLTLGVLVARRIVSIWSGRRRNLAGSRLHVRLVVIFSIMAALPAIIMAVFSAFFFHFGVQSWFSENVRTAVYDSQQVAEAYLEEHQQVIRADILAMANDIDRQATMMMDEQAAYDRVLDTQSLLRNLSESLIFDGNNRILAKSGLTFSLTLEKVPDYMLDRVREGEVVVLTNENDDRVRALTKLNSGQDNFLFVGRKVDQSVLSFLASAQDATERYQQLESSYSGLQITVTLIFVVVALLLMMAAIWVGIVLARQLVTPIGTLISVSDRVRAGDLEARVPKREQIEEFDYLADSFNRMTNQIQQQRDELIATNRQLDDRRRFTEAVLAGVPAAVIGINAKNEITFVNTMASDLLSAAGELVGQSLIDLVPDLDEALEKARKRPNKVTSTELSFITPESKKRILNIRIAIETINETDHSAVVTFDDITELQSAQRKAAWADVARRIAHEIKNPLTPIQLSAERLKRKYKDEIKSDLNTFEACTDTIIKHVGDIGKMVNEFSDFARMPEPSLKRQKIISDLKELLLFQRSANQDIEFEIIDDTKKDVFIYCDSQLMRQAFTNILQNSIDSLSEKLKTDKDFQAKIAIYFSITDENFILSVSDNGLGFPESKEGQDLTEPYITYKEKGTGLGLAIVKKIIADHEGQLLLGGNEYIQKHKKWNDLGGAHVTFVLPVADKDRLSEDIRKSA